MSVIWEVVTFMWSHCNDKLWRRQIGWSVTRYFFCFQRYYSDAIMSAMSQITSVSIVYSSVCSGTDQRKHQSSAPLAFVRGIHRRRVNSPHKGPVTRKTFPFNDVIKVFRSIITQWLSEFTIMIVYLSEWALPEEFTIMMIYPSEWNLPETKDGITTLNKIENAVQRLHEISQAWCLSVQKTGIIFSNKHWCVFTIHGLLLSYY